MIWSIGGRQELGKSFLGVAAARRWSIRRERGLNRPRPLQRSSKRCGKPSVLFSRAGPAYLLRKLGPGPWALPQTSNPLLAGYLEGPIFSLLRALVEIACR